MADDKLKAGPESPGEGSVGDAQTVTKPPVPETVEEPAAGTRPGTPAGTVCYPWNGRGCSSPACAAG